MQTKMDPPDAFASRFKKNKTHTASKLHVQLVPIVFCHSMRGN